MKLTNVNFLTKANAKINKNEKGIKIVSALLVISITLISAFSITVTKAVNEYKEDYRARTLEVDPWLSELDDNVIESIKNTEHVVDIFPLEGIRNEAFNIVQSSDENLQKMIDQEKNNYLNIWSLFKNEKRSVIAGKTLDESPVLSCVVPMIFILLRLRMKIKSLIILTGKVL